MRNLRGGLQGLGAALIVTLAGCGSNTGFCTGPCPIPAPCVRLRSQPADHICIRDLGKYPPNYEGCSSYNADITGFGLPATWQGFVSTDDQVDPDDFDGPAECTNWSVWRAGERGQTIRASAFEVCPDPMARCGIPPACTPMFSGCFGATDGSGSIRFVSVTSDPMPAGLQYRLHASGEGLVCPGSEWSFEDAVVDEDCMGAQVLLPCADGELTTIRLTTAGLRIRRGDQPEIPLASGAGACRDAPPPPPPPPPPDECTPTLQGCFAGPGRAWLRIDAPTCSGSGAARRCVQSGAGRGLACPNREWTFAGAVADADCMGARLMPSCGGETSLRAAPGGATLQVGAEQFTLTSGGTCQ